MFCLLGSNYLLQLKIGAHLLETPSEILQKNLSFWGMGGATVPQNKMPKELFFCENLSGHSVDWANTTCGSVNNRSSGEP